MVVVLRMEFGRLKGELPTGLWGGFRSLSDRGGDISCAIELP